MAFKSQILSSEAGPASLRSYRSAKVADQPPMPREFVEKALTRLSHEDFVLALQHKLVPAGHLLGRSYYAAANICAEDKATQDELSIVGRILPVDYRGAVKRVLGHKLIRLATNRLHVQRPQLSNKHGVRPLQLVILILGIVAFTALSFSMPSGMQHLPATLLFSIFFLSIISLRFMSLLPHSDYSLVRPIHLTDEKLPVYSVLVPLFRETGVLGQLVTALSMLDYPAAKLDIKLILEETDVAMQRAVNELDLDDRFDIIVVPAGNPQTKPRALNYALLFARGDLLTIFDAEDVPSPNQLRLAAETFAASDRDVACLQAELTFFNSTENWISKQFTLEYASLFNVILPSLARDRLPLPLGGTSNHFRRNILEFVGGWDPYNVTEDADLGLRLARAGFQTGIVASETLEEANVSVPNWIKQRSRWLKGFLLTWLVHMRDPKRTFEDLGFGGFWVMTATTLGVFVSALLHPLLLIKVSYDIAFQPPPENASTLNDIVLGVSILLLIGGYVTAFMVANRGMKQRRFRGWRIVLLTMPAYWFLSFPAGLLALYDSIVRPFHWRKTDHGISSVDHIKAVENTRQRSKATVP